MNFTTHLVILFVVATAGFACAWFCLFSLKVRFGIFLLSILILITLMSYSMIYGGKFANDIVTVASAYKEFIISFISGAIIGLLRYFR